MDPLNLFVPLTKVDEAKREVWGIAVEEAPDKMGEIMDYAKSKPRFEAWSQQIHKASGGKSFGNVREMHEPRAIGKLVDLQYDDEAKKIYVGAKIVDDAAWKKVTEGVYTGFSVGGKYGAKWADPTRPTLLRYEAIPSELSTVDNPAMYGATFELIRADGSSELRKFAAPLAKADNEEKPAGEDKPKEEDDKSKDDKPKDDEPPADDKPAEDEAESDSEDVGKAAALKANLRKLAKCYPDAVAYDGGDWDVSRAVNVLAQVSGLLESETWKGEPDHVALVSSILSQLQQFLDGEIAEAQQNAAREAQEIADEIVANAEEMVEQAASVVESEGNETLEMASRIADLQKAAATGSNARVILESKIHEAYTVTCDQLLQRGYIDRETRLKISGLMGEMLTKFADALGPELEKVMLTPEDVDFIAAKLAQGEMRKLAAGDLSKRGARHNATDSQLLQSIHDSACTLGAACATASTEDAGKAAQAEQLKKMIAEELEARGWSKAPATTELVKLAKALQTNGELIKRAEGLEKQFKALEDRVQVVEQQPEAQLPTLRVIKRDGTSHEEVNPNAGKGTDLVMLEKLLTDESISGPTRAELGKVLALRDIRNLQAKGPQKIG